jgi:hypothetical protein
MIILDDLRIEWAYRIRLTSATVIFRLIWHWSTLCQQQNLCIANMSDTDNGPNHHWHLYYFLLTFTSYILNCWHILVKYFTAVRKLLVFIFYFIATVYVMCLFDSDFLQITSRKYHKRIKYYFAHHHMFISIKNVFVTLWQTYLLNFRFILFYIRPDWKWGLLRKQCFISQNLNLKMQTLKIYFSLIIRILKEFKTTI